MVGRAGMEGLFPKDTVFTVTNLTSLLKDILEASFPNITLEGEISNFRPNSTGHLYFTLKDEGAQISAVMFRGRAATLTFRPKDGTKVRCTGSISVYAPRGNYQIIISKMEIAGQGDILQMLEERKRRLAAEGLFNSERKRKLPAFPKTVGVVTSATGAALRDILQITRRRNPGVNVVILPAQVQGDGAALTIEKQIQTANAFNICDVLIVGRGGGSLEDLLPFSDESLVRAVAASKIPVVSAVGHEIDWSLCDYAADVRAPTPSAAAELVVPIQAEVAQAVKAYADDFYNTIMQKIERQKLMIKSFNAENMEIRLRSIEQPLINRFENAKVSLSQNIEQKIADCKNRIASCVNTIEGASPRTILARGYAMVRTADGKKIVTQAGQVKSGEKLEIIPSQGVILATVNETKI